MDLNNLRLFTTVVQAGSFSAAGERSGVPVATVSRRIAALEQDLNMQLFDRFKSGVKPTMLGQRLYEEVHLSLDQLAQAQRLLADKQQPLSGKLRLSTSPGLEPVWDRVDKFQQQYPQVEVHCQVTDRVLDLVEDGIDVAFRIGDLHTDSVIARPLMQMHAKLVTAPALLAERGIPATPADLLKFPCAGWARNGQKNMQWHFDGQSVSIPYHFSSNDSYALAHAAQKGQMIFQLPDYIADRLIRDFGLVEVLPDFVQPGYLVSAIYPAHRHPSSLIQAFLAVCLSQTTV
ncbi:LysR family transcriptional regulator [Paralysiella testudinis]|uniref:LysR family transcriptional regulator n=1 Tax=Paralysiella testudinis TaxID=2809020 RepID=A0A892ZHW0_9NEIS|nr:LysR family transcriptional regulator [Paralysiella testudinis]QRQ81417.1 LysR family transcriptional regulator [Paralysiella testudinis]